MLNPYFNNFNAQNEQELLQSLIVESIQIFGHSVYYIPRNLGNFNQIYLTDDQSTYSTVIPTEVYIDDVGGNGFVGRDVFSKFGLAIKDSIDLSMAYETFQRVIKPITLQSRPMEGDLIYFTLNKKCFQIQFTNNKEIFYPLGILPLYRMTLELFEYSDETFNTGIPEIDILQQNFSLNVLDNVYTTEAGLILTDEQGNRITREDYSVHNIDPISDNQELEIEAGTFINNDESNAFGYIQT